MLFRKFLSTALGTAGAFLILTGAAPRESGYSGVPQKREARGSEDDLRVVREDAVKPEEVFKNGVQEVSLIATDTGYLPARILVRKDIPVRLFITSASSSTLCFIMDEFSIKKGVATQVVEEVRFLPTKAGQYKFYCPVKEIQGSVVVRD
jgi:heme/copper-type cytochrome/quinol oxidase subunit 2